MTIVLATALVGLVVGSEWTADHASARASHRRRRHPSPFGRPLEEDRATTEPWMTGRLDVLVLADTHLRREWPNRRLPARVHDLLERSDVVLHAGDVLQPEHLDMLGAHAPLHVVRGNNDHELHDVPEVLELELAGVRIGMIHDSGPARGRAQRLHARFPGCDVVVFGHSHVPWNERGVDGQLLFNPGSPTERRQQPRRTVGRLLLADGQVERAVIEPVDS